MIAALFLAAVVQIVPGPAGAPCTHGSLVAEPQCDGCAPARRADWRLRDGAAAASLDLSGAAQWRVRAVSHGCWSAPVLATESAEPSPVVLWHASHVTATVAPPRGEKPPAALQLRLQSPHIDAAVDCEPASGRWSCEVPATQLDLRIAAPGYVPHYVWGVTPPADLRTLQLRRGGSVSGRAALAARAQEGPITVVLAPDDLLGSARGSMRTMKVETNERGFFQFGGLDSGTYTVTATRAGWSAARAEGITVAENTEAVVRPEMTLQPLADVELVLDPALDDEREWTVRLDRLAEWGRRDRVAEGPAQGGRWSARGLESGSYLVTVTAAGGGVVHQHGYRLDPQMPPLTVQIGRIAVRGKVTSAGDPVEADLRFFTEGGKKISMRSTADGTFRGALPRSDEPWQVDVTPAGERTRIRLRDLVIDADDTEAQLDLELPPGRVEGRTVDPSGAPVRATVYVARDGHPLAETRSAADGTFRVIGVEPGDVTLRAIAPAGDSALVPHRVGGADDEEVTLVVPPRAKVGGRVVSPGGRGVAGAIVRVLTPSTGAVVDAISGPSGEFEIRAPARDEYVYVFVIATGFPVKATAVSLRGEDQTHDLVLARRGGRVFIPSHDARSLPTIAPSGVPALSVYVYTDPGASGFPRNKVPGGYLLELEPGPYTFCADRAARQCVSRVLAAGTDERIDFPEEAR